MSYSESGVAAASATKRSDGRVATTIRTPDQRLRVFVSSTLGELARERQAVRAAVGNLRLAPVMFEMGARPHPPRELYRAYLEQSHVFIGIYWQRYGWVAPGMEISGLEDEYRLSGDRPKLIYVKTPAPDREEGLDALLATIREDDTVSYKPFTSAEELQELVENDLALILTERFERVDDLRSSQPLAGTERPTLPRPTTALVGRETEIGAVSSLLLAEDTRLVTLVGPGGIGKSRLALAVANGVQSRFPDGVYFVPLAPIRDPANVPGAIARVLGLATGSGVPPMESLQAFLHDKKTLLLLDNFEQLIDAAPQVAELLESSAGLKVLVTSRAVLRLSFEFEYQVPPLALAASTPGGARLSEAVQLFAARARAVQPTFELDDETLPLVAEICKRLDGLPLAIELAAARIKFLPPRALLKRLDRRLDLLTGSAVDRPDRQQTLRNTIDWSYQLLSRDEQQAFERLALFVGGFCLEAAEAVLGRAAGNDIAVTLYSLTDKSLLKHQLGDDEPRFFMLETIREFAAEKLEESGEAAKVRERFISYYRELCMQAGDGVLGHQQQAWVDWLEREHPNLRVAIRLSLVEDIRAAAEMGWNLWAFWWIRGHQSEGMRWMQAVLQCEDELSLLERARVYYVAGAMAVVSADYPTAGRYAQACLELAREAGDAATEGLGLLGVGLVSLYSAEWETARQQLESGLRIFRELRDWWGQAHLLHFLWRLAAVQGQALEKLELLEESAALFRTNGDKSALVLVLHNLAMAQLGAGNELRAAELLAEGMGYSVEIHNRWYVAYCFEGFACLAVRKGQLHDAARLFGLAEALREQVHAPLAPADAAFYAGYLEALESSSNAAQLSEVRREGRGWSLVDALAFVTEMPGAADAPAARSA